MTQRVLAEALSQYLDGGLTHEAEYLALFGDRRQDLASLIQIVKLLRAYFAPVEPDPLFMADLRRRLLTIPLADLPPATPRSVAPLVVGAVAFGSIMSAAAIYYFVSSRYRSARAA